MQAEGKVDGHSANGPERRTHPRHPVDEDATLLILSQGSPLPCHLLELSLEGCRLRTKAPFLAGIEIRVEVAFRINGIALRFSGVTAWTLDKHVVGVHFVGLTSRRRDELADVLGELAADLASAAKNSCGRSLRSPTSEGTGDGKAYPRTGSDERRAARNPAARYPRTTIFAPAYRAAPCTKPCKARSADAVASCGRYFRGHSPHQDRLSDTRTHSGPEPGRLPHSYK